MQTRALRQQLIAAFDKLRTAVAASTSSPNPCLCSHSRQRSQTSTFYVQDTALTALWAARQHRTSSAWRAPTMNLPHIIIKTFIQPNLLESAGLSPYNGKVVLVHITKVYGEVKISLHAFLIYTLEGVEWVHSSNGRCTPRNGSPVRTE
jgi:hypothetical protein